mgnify:CR=1 FL=1
MSDYIKRSDVGLTDFEIIMCKGDYREALKMLLEKIASAPSQTDILDKIRFEIENDWQLKKYPSSPFSCGLRQAIAIIDKYKNEVSK